MRLQTLKKWFTLCLQLSGYWGFETPPPWSHTGCQMGRVTFSGPCVWSMVKLRSGLETEHPAPSGNLVHAVHKSLRSFHLDGSKDWIVGRGWQSCSIKHRDLTSYHLEGDATYATRGQEDFKFKNTQGKNKKLPRRKPWHLCHCLFNTYYVAISLCRALPSEK